MLILFIQCNWSAKELRMLYPFISKKSLVILLVWFWYMYLLSYILYIVSTVKEKDTIYIYIHLICLMGLTYRSTTNIYLDKTFPSVCLNNFFFILLFLGIRELNLSLIVWYNIFLGQLWKTFCDDMIWKGT